MARVIGHDHAATLDTVRGGIHHVGAGDQPVDQAPEEDRLCNLASDPATGMGVVSGTDFG